MAENKTVSSTREPRGQKPFQMEPRHSKGATLIVGGSSTQLSNASEQNVPIKVFSQTFRGT